MSNTERKQVTLDDLERRNTAAHLNRLLKYPTRMRGALHQEFDFSACSLA
jgi:hypothetical protein